MKLLYKETIIQNCNIGKLVTFVSSSMPDNYKPRTNRINVRNVASRDDKTLLEIKLRHK